MANEYQELPDDDDEFDPGYQGLPDGDEFGNSVWLKYQHKWAHGHDKDWQWQEIQVSDLENGEPNRGILNEIYNKNSWSDKYRGINCEVHPAPDKEWLEKEISSCKQQVERLKDRIEQLKALINPNDGDISYSE